LGVDNVIELTGYKGTNKLSSSTTNGTITDLGKNQYILRPENKGECIISFYNKGQKIVSKVFKIDTLGNLIARLAGIRDSFATVQEIISNPFLILEFPKTIFKHNFYIRSFVLSMDPLGFEDANPFEIVGNTIPSYVTKRIKEMHKGDWLVFEQIIVLCPDCIARKISPFRLIIK